MSRRPQDQNSPDVIVDEPGMAERFQRGLQRAFQTPHKPGTPKGKTRPVSEGRARKGKTGR